MNKKFVLTTPLYYTNASPHCGHAYTTIAADVIARYHRLIGDDVFFLTGTDENAGKVAEAAREKGKQPKEFVDEIAKEFRKAWKELDIIYDGFIRTTDKKHWKFAQRFLQKIYDQGDIYKGKYEGLYCQACEKFLKESDLVNGLCPDHKVSPIDYSEENYFFKLSKYKNQIEKLIKSKEIEVLPKERENEILGKLNLGLEDLSISRANVSWGIPLPFDQSQRVYCWVEALQGYISGMPKKYWPAELHLMARDITWFHAVIWPALLLAADHSLPKKIFSHGFFTVEGQKMSKTIGNIIVPQELIKKFGIDGTRYLMLTEIPFGKDGDISIRRFTERYNSDLANGLGNLVQRVVKLAENAKLHISQKSRKAGITNDKLRPVARSYVGVRKLQIKNYQDYNKFLKDYNFNECLAWVWKKISAVDKYIDQKRPWEKKEKELIELLQKPVQEIQEIAYLLRPFLPETSEKIEKILAGPKIKTGKPLFPRI